MGSRNRHAPNRSPTQWSCMDEFPPIDTIIPAFRYDAVRCELYGRKRRSCSPVYS